MARKIMISTLLVIIAISVVNSQTTAKQDTRILLIELSKMLTQIPESKEECQVLLKRIKSWQEEKLRQLEKPIAKLNITEPKDGAAVPERPLVTGTVADPNVIVNIIVHPMEVSDYYVQPNATVKRDGTWKTIIYIGRPGNIDVGKRFEVIAVANPKAKLNEGDILSDWPEAQWKSEVIEITRR